MIIMICSSTIQIVSILILYATEINRCTSHMLSRGLGIRKTLAELKAGLNQERVSANAGRSR